MESANDEFMSLLQSQNGYKRSRLSFTPAGITCIAVFEDTGSAFGALWNLCGNRLGERISSGLHVTFETRSASSETQQQVQRSVSSPLPATPTPPPPPPPIMPIAHRPDRHPLDRAGRPSRMLYCVNLPHEVPEGAINAVFAKQPGVLNVRLERRRDIQHSRFLCFVEFNDIPTASQAIEDLSGFRIRNSTRPIWLIFAKNSVVALKPRDATESPALTIAEHDDPWARTSAPETTADVAVETNAQTIHAPHNLHPRDEQHKLFIGGLRSAITSEALENLYYTQPGVKDVQFSRHSGKPICFVTFWDAASASKALAATYGMSMHGGRIKPRDAVIKDQADTVPRSCSTDMNSPLQKRLNSPCNTLFIANIPELTTKEAMEAVFVSQPGYLELTLWESRGKLKCFVLFRNEVYAGNAIEDLDGYQITRGLRGKLRFDFADKPLLRLRQHAFNMDLDPTEQLSSEDEDAEDGWGPCDSSAQIGMAEEQFFDYHSDQGSSQEEQLMQKPDLGFSGMIPDSIHKESSSRSWSANDAGDQMEQQTRPEPQPPLLIKPTNPTVANSMPSSKAFRSPEAMTINSNWLSKRMVIAASCPKRTKDTNAINCTVHGVAEEKDSTAEKTDVADEITLPILESDDIQNEGRHERTHAEDTIKLASPNKIRHRPRKAKVELLALFKAPDTRQRQSLPDFAQSIFCPSEAIDVDGDAPILKDNTTSKCPPDDPWNLMPFLESAEEQAEPHRETENNPGVRPDAESLYGKMEEVSLNDRGKSACFLDLPMELRFNIYGRVFDSAFVFMTKVEMFRQYTTNRFPCSSPHSSGIDPELFPCLVQDTTVLPQAVRKLEYSRRPGLPNKLFGRPMRCRNLPFEKKHSIGGLVPRSMNLGLLLTCRRLGAEFSEYAHNRLALAFGNQKGVTRWLQMQDSAGIKRGRSHAKRGTPWDSMFRLDAPCFVLNSKAHIKNLCLEIKDHGEPQDAKYRPLRFKYFENWRKVCANIIAELPTLRTLGVSVHVPRTQDHKPCQLNLEGFWVQPLLEFGMSTSLCEASVTLVAAYHTRGVTIDTGTAFSEVLRRKILGWTDEDALEAIADFQSRPWVSRHTSETAWNVVRASNGLETYSRAEGQDERDSIENCDCK